LEKRNVRIEQVDNGFIIRTWKPGPGKEVYEDCEEQEIVANSAEEVNSFMQQWLAGNGSPLVKNGDEYKVMSQLKQQQE